MLVPVQAYLTRGVGVHREELVAFEIALRDAGIAAQNLVAVSSILPPGCELVSREIGERHLQPGQILHVVLSREETAEPGRLVGASIGIARPQDENVHGFVAEHGGFGLQEQTLEVHAQDLAATMLASTLGIDLDDRLPWSERAARLSEDGRIRDTRSIAATARGDADGRWTCVVAACVFLMEWMLPGRSS